VFVWAGLYIVGAAAAAICFRRLWVAVFWPAALLVGVCALVLLYFDTAAAVKDRSDVEH
jgi:hypothetical protein